MTPLDPALHGHLEGLAYRMLGSVADAEDVVQDAFLAWDRTGRPALDEPRAWFTRTCTNLCLDRLRANARRREEYVGEWLPEPLPQAESDPLEMQETLSMALMVTVQRLPATERAAFLLHDVFGYRFEEVAEILDLESAHCRQLAVRARRHLQDSGRQQGATSREDVERLSAAFFAAVEAGNVDQLHATLAEDVEFRSDGGGKVAAVPRPIHGRKHVAAFALGVLRAAAGAVAHRPAWFNGRPGVLVFEDGTLVTAIQFEVRNGHIQGIYAQRNPDKLARLTQRDH